MKAFIAACAAIAVIGVASWWILNNELNYSSADRGAAPDSVRLD